MRDQTESMAPGAFLDGLDQTASPEALDVAAGCNVRQPKKCPGYILVGDRPASAAALSDIGEDRFLGHHDADLFPVSLRDPSSANGNGSFSNIPGTRPRIAFERLVRSGANIRPGFTTRGSRLPAPPRARELRRKRFLWLIGPASSVRSTGALDRVASPSPPRPHPVVSADAVALTAGMLTLPAAIHKLLPRAASFRPCASALPHARQSCGATCLECPAHPPEGARPDARRACTPIAQMRESTSQWAGRSLAHTARSWRCMRVGRAGLTVKETGHEHVSGRAHSQGADR